MATYFVTWDAGQGPQTIKLTGVNADEIRAVMRARLGPEAESAPGYRVIEHQAKRPFSETLPDLAVATLVMAAALVLTAVVERRIRRWLED